MLPLFSTRVSIWISLKNKQQNLKFKKKKISFLKFFLYILFFKVYSKKAHYGINQTINRIL